MSLMGALYVGSSGLRTSQNALNTTAHNISNLDTTGYTRQQILLGTRRYQTISVNTSSVANQQVGLGVVYSKTRQVRDYFLDQQYRKESGRSAFYEVSTTTMENVEDLLGELNQEEFDDCMNNLWDAVQLFSTNPAGATYQDLLVTRCSEFLARAQAVYDGLKEYQDNLNSEVLNYVDTINAYGKQIEALNNQIVKIEAGGVEEANDLRDARNSILDSLSEIVKISYTEDAYGYVSVKIEGEDFVKPDIVFEMTVQQDAETGFYTPYWKATGNQVFNLTQEISSDMDTDIGGLKATILARGDRYATYEDLGMTEGSTKDSDYYNENIAQSIIMNIEAEFDQLVHFVTSKINEVLESGGYPAMFELTEARDGYTTMNLTMNSTLMSNPTELGFITEDDQEDYTTAEALAAIFEEEIYSLNPNVTTVANLLDYYDNLVSQIATSGSIYNSIYSNQQLTVDATESARQQIVGVSSDEELEYMVMYQNAYNASSRYINVIDELLETLIGMMV